MNAVNFYHHPIILSEIWNIAEDLPFFFGLNFVESDVLGNCSDPVNSGNPM